MAAWRREGGKAQRGEGAKVGRRDGGKGEGGTEGRKRDMR
jgi:hypothetical protein